MAQEWRRTTIYRETGRIVKVGPFDGRLAIFFVVLALFPSMFLLYLLLLSCCFFWYLEYVGYNLPNAKRKIFTVIAGKKRYGVHYWRQKKFRF